MEYFTEKIRNGINFKYGKEKAAEYDAMWDENLKKYYKLLDSISDRLDVKVYKHFSEIGFHDFRLEKLELVHNEYCKKPALQISLIVTDEKDRFEIFFISVSKFEVKEVENDKYNRGIDRWIYEEILPVDDKILSFEVLFASGATFFISFPNKSLKIKKLKNN